ncbi:hypothetical protein AAC387_Pa05g3814 [Persea americana]
MGRAEDHEMEEEEEDEDENRVMEWEDGLPTAADLMPLSQPLIPPELASAFSISPEPSRTATEVSRASQDTLAFLRSYHHHANGLGSIPLFDERHQDPTNEIENSTSEMRKGRRSGAEEADSAAAVDEQSARTLKRPRLVWTPQLHKRFVDVVAHLGIKNAVPKTIMQLMNVEGLTRENVASHLQKYRLYLRRMEGVSDDSGGPSSSDHLFASTPIPQSFQEAGAGQLPAPMMPRPTAQMMPVPVLGMPHGHISRTQSGGGPSFHGFESHPYNIVREQHQKYGSIISYPHMTPSEK